MKIILTTADTLRKMLQKTQGTQGKSKEAGKKETSSPIYIRTREMM
jgi:hypothetical protein